MSTTVATQHRVENPYATLAQGAGGGLLAGLLFGVLLQFGLGRMVTVGALLTLGEPSLTAGWAFHTVNSAVFGGLYALLTLWRRVRPLATTPASGAALGAGYGTLLWLVNIGFVWPLWLGAVGYTAPPIPNLAVLPLVGHLLYGVGLGAMFGTLAE